jgi:hypothetical protein
MARQPGRIEALSHRRSSRIIRPRRQFSAAELQNCRRNGRDDPVYRVASASHRRQHVHSWTRRCREFYSSLRKIVTLWSLLTAALAVVVLFIGVSDALAQSHVPALGLEPLQNPNDPIQGIPLKDACFNMGQWPTVLAATDWLGDAAGTVDLMSNDEQQACFANLRAAGRRLSLGVPVLKAECQSASACFEALRAIRDRIVANGGGADIIGAFYLEEPLVAVFSGQIPGHVGDFTYAVNETLNFIQLLRDNYPSAKIIEIEAYPYFDVNRLQAWFYSMGCCSPAPDYLESTTIWTHQVG